MGNLYSKKKHKNSQGTITELDKSILSLKTQKKKLDDQLNLLEKRIDLHHEAARQLVKVNKKDRALLVLKKKKLTELQIEQLQALVLNIEGTLNNIELMKHQNRVMETLKEGNDALRRLQMQMPIEDVRRIMDDTAEAHAYQEELRAVLAGSLTSDQDADVEAELEALESIELAHEVAEMPTVPIHTVPIHKVEPPVAQAADASEMENEAVEEPRPAREALLAS